LGGDSRKASSSAWAELSIRIWRRLCPRPVIIPSNTTTAPTGGRLAQGVSFFGFRQGFAHVPGVVYKAFPFRKM
jgi:hypothetical protein